ncbi:MAG: hypothetical protein K2X11_05360 [Acetobacteraceae bacterium]|nr:hypothetical protein [Acetobacteraceae bacterium]
MAEDPKPTIPRPPSPEALREISEQQAMIADEWAPNPAPTEATPEEKDTERQPG